MTTPIVTPLIVRDAEALAKAAVESGPPFRGAIVERVTAALMRVDVASREQSGAKELLAALKSVEWSGEYHDRDSSWPCCPSCGADPPVSEAALSSGRHEGEPGVHCGGCILGAAIAKAEGR